MKFAFPLTLRNLYFYTTCFILAILNSQSVFGQSLAKPQKSFDSLNNVYYSGKMSEDEYLDRADELRKYYLLTKGIHFTTEELTNLLSLYKKIAWSKKKYDNRRKNYYIAFLDNAAMFEERGAAMYYAEKIAQEYRNNGEKDAFTVATTVSKIYIEQDSYDKIIALYVQQKTHVKTLPELLRKNKIDVPTGIDALTFMSVGVLGSYINTNDSLAVYETEQLINQIGKEVIKRSQDNKLYMLYSEFFMLIAQHFIAIYEEDTIKTGNVLQRFEKLKRTYKDVENGIIDQNVLPWKINYFIASKNIDSASLYIKQLENRNLYTKDQQAQVYEYKAKLQFLKGDLDGSNKWFTLALEEERNVQSKLMKEMDELMYAFTEAENTRMDLEHSEAVKEERTKWLIITSVGAALIILSIYLLMLYRSRKAKAQIEELNNTADMQIIAMEETKHQAIRDEQQRLGQDLHDGLSSSIAAVRYQLETLIMDTQDAELKDKLSKLQNETVKAYEAARNKSHEWFSEGDEAQQLSFEKQIRLLTDKALPDNRYAKTIHVDSDSLINVSTDTRIALLRIIQESVTNIIKHAKAKKVEILLYEEDDTLILSIADDGSGFDSKSNNKKSMLGLQSIKRRVQYLNGKEDIKSDKNGTIIKVFIPLT